MAMGIGNLRFFEKEEGVDRRRQPFIPGIIFGKSMDILRTIQQFQFGPLIADGDVDTTLSLSIPGSRNSAPVLSPTPLRCFPPTNFPEEANENSLTLSLGPLLPKKRKREGNGGKERAKRSGNGDGEDPRPLTPCIEEFPALAQALKEKGATPVFLYRKKLVGSDVKPDLNRLFVTNREPLFKFLTAEEAAAVDGGAAREGIKVLGIDECGKPYNLVLRKWRSLDMTVIVSEWRKLAAANTARKGDSVEIWGFRFEGKLGFAITFRRRSSFT